MNPRIERLRADDFDELMTLLNLCFQKPEPNWFADRLPALYQPTDEAMNHQLAIRDQGRIVAVVGLFPLMMCVGEIRLKVGGIGGVSCHPDQRGKGWMSMLLDQANADMRAQGYHLSYLSGQRQRYRNHGWEIAGSRFQFNLLQANVRHQFAQAAPPAVTLTPLTEPVDMDTLHQLQQLHDAQPLRMERPGEPLPLRMRSWRNLPYIARDAQGRVVGYAVCTPKMDTVTEVVGSSDDVVIDMLRVLREMCEPYGMNVNLPPLPSALSLNIAGWAEDIRLVKNGNWQVYDWQPVLSSLLQIKHQSQPLPSGRVVVNITGQGCFELSVNDTQARCTKADQQADLELDATRATALLLGAWNPAMVMKLPASVRVLQAWCPLPLHISRQDEV